MTNTNNYQEQRAIDNKELLELGRLRASTKRLRDSIEMTISHYPEHQLLEDAYEGVSEALGAVEILLSILRGE